MSELEISPQQVKQSDPTKKTHGNRFKIPEKLSVKAMQNSGMTIREVANISGMSPATVLNVWNNPELDDLKPEIVERTKKGMTGLFYKRGLQSLLAMTPAKFENSSLSQLAIASGIFTEKGRLMENLSTENVAHANVMNSIDSQVKSIESRLNDI
mgnify:CR=1 FL=1